MVTIPLARWETRFWAWLIDIIIVTIVYSIAAGALRPLAPGSGIWDFRIGGFPTADIGLQSIVLFLYWTILEGYHGKSVGKMALSIRMAGRSGEATSYGAAAIESFGKAFLLPIDCLIGWLAMPGSKQRLFNRLSNTIVIRDTYEPPAGVEYRVEKE